MFIVDQGNAIDPILDTLSAETHPPLHSGNAPLAVALTPPPKVDEVAIKAQVDAKVLQKGIQSVKRDRGRPCKVELHLRFL